MCEKGNEISDVENIISLFLLFPHLLEKGPKEANINRFKQLLLKTNKEGQAVLVTLTKHDRHLKCHCDEISQSFFLSRITYHHVRCPFFHKEKNKTFSFIKISPLEK